MIFVIGAFSAASLRIMPSSMQITRSINIFRSTKVVVNTLFQAFQESIIISRNEIELTNLKSNYQDYDEIIIENVDFSYSKDIPIFQSVSLTIKKGECVGIIGKSGLG